MLEFAEVLEKKVCPICGGELKKNRRNLHGIYTQFTCFKCSISSSFMGDANYALGNLYGAALKKNRQNQLDVCKTCVDGKEQNFAHLPCSACMVTVQIPVEEVMKLKMNKPSAMMSVPTMYSQLRKEKNNETSYLL
jgi:hypothetical protein